MHTFNPISLQSKRACDEKYQASAFASPRVGHAQGGSSSSGDSSGSEDDAGLFQQELSEEGFDEFSRSPVGVSLNKCRFVEKLIFHPRHPGPALLGSPQWGARYGTHHVCVICDFMRNGGCQVDNLGPGTFCNQPAPWIRTPPKCCSCAWDGLSMRSDARAALQPLLYPASSVVIPYGNSKPGMLPTALQPSRFLHGAPVDLVPLMAQQTWLHFTFPAAAGLLKPLSGRSTGYARPVSFSVTLCTT